MKVAAYMAQIKYGEAAEDAMPALRIHGRTLQYSWDAQLDVTVRWNHTRGTG